MKKIFTLLLGASLATSAMAVPVQEFVCTGNHLPALKTTATSFNPADLTLIAPQGTPDGMCRIMESGTGEAWLAMFQSQGRVIDFFDLSNQQTGEATTWQDYPFYLVLLTTNDGERTSIFQSYVIWPSMVAMDGDMYDSNYRIDEAKVLAKYGSLEAGYAPMPIEQVISQDSRIPVLTSFYGFPLILQPDLLGATTSWKGQDYGTKPCTVNQSDGTVNLNGSYLDWKSFDSDLNEAEMDFNLQLGTLQQDYSVTNTQLAAFSLSGSMTVIGFSDLTLNFDEVHAFNCGITDNFTEYGVGYEEDFTPVKRYYFTWCDSNGLTYVATRMSDGQEVHAWDADRLENGELSKIMPLLVSQDAVYRYFNTAVFVPENASDFYGMFTMPEAKYTTKQEGGRLVLDKWLSVPTAYELVPGNYNAAVCEQDGFTGVWEYYYMFPGEKFTYLGIGDENYGFNFKFSSDGWNGYTVMGYSTEPIFLHDNANNWNVMTTVPAVSSAEHNAIDIDINDPTSVEEVISNAPVVSTQYFNLQGQRLNMAPERGIYIQREIKADGTVKASKVVK